MLELLMPTVDMADVFAVNPFPPHPIVGPALDEFHFADVVVLHSGQVDDWAPDAAAWTTFVAALTGVAPALGLDGADRDDGAGHEGPGVGIGWSAAEVRVNLADVELNHSFTNEPEGAIFNQAIIGPGGFNETQDDYEVEEVVVVGRRPLTPREYWRDGGGGDGGEGGGGGGGGGGEGGAGIGSWIDVDGDGQQDDIGVKSGVSVTQLMDEMKAVFDEIVRACQQVVPGVTPVITSTNDGTHRPDSRHYTN